VVRNLGAVCCLPMRRVRHGRARVHPQGRSAKTLARHLRTLRKSSPLHYSCLVCLKVVTVTVNYHPTPPSHTHPPSKYRTPHVRSRKVKRSATRRTDSILHESRHDVCSSPNPFLFRYVTTPGWLPRWPQSFFTLNYSTFL
jgi:hypothetical protein